jgi:glycosyltransferase involved in cell wall biosynthesis
MLILLDCRPLQQIGFDSEKGRLILSVVTGLARDGTAQWLLLTDHGYRGGLLPGVAGVSVITRRALPGGVGWKLWYDWLIPGIVRKYAPDRVMLTGGVAVPSMPVPQDLWMPVGLGPSALDSGRRLPPLYARRLDASLRLAETVFCFSGKDRSWLDARGHTDQHKLILVRPAPALAAAPLSGSEREREKAHYARGMEYFFLDARGAGEQEVIRLLKAFSFFKKRQLSNMQMVVTGVLSPGLREKLDTYRYGEDLHWCDPGAHGQGAIGGAYAALFPFEGDTLGAGLLAAWQAGVPVLIRKGGRLQEMAGDAAFVAEDGDSNGLAIQLMSVYKDEPLRAAIIEKGFSRLSAFDPAGPVGAVRTAIGVS